MKNFLKYVGPILVLLGVIILALYFFGISNSNVYLASAGIIMVLGIVSHILINKYANWFRV